MVQLYTHTYSKNIVVSLLAASMLAGCATSINPDGALVREVSPDKIPSCRFVGYVTATEAFGWDIHDDRRGALNQIRNKVAELGGNYYLLTNDSSHVVASFEASAYRCP